MGRSGEDGTWETGEVDPGGHTVTVLAPGRAPQAARVEVRDGGARHDLEVPPARYDLSGAVRGTGGLDGGLLAAHGAVVVELPYAGKAWLVREILRGAGDLVVLEPPEARAAIADEVS